MKKRTFVRLFCVMLMIFAVLAQLMGCRKTPETELPADETTEIVAPQPEAAPEPGEQRCIVLSPGRLADKQAQMGLDAVQSKEPAAEQADATEETAMFQLCELLGTALEQKGYRVVQTRASAQEAYTEECAAIANREQADAYVILQTGSPDESGRTGVCACCTSAESAPSNELYLDSRELSTMLSAAVALETGIENLGVSETDSRDELNGSQVPVSLLELDSAACESDLTHIVRGIERGISLYLSGHEASASALETAPTPLPEPKLQPLAALEDALQEKIDALDSKWDIWVERLSDGAQLHCNAHLEGDEPMVAASLIKLFIMGAIYQRIEEGSIQEADVSETLFKMITHSDNDASNELTCLMGDGDEQVGMEAINQWAASIGCEDVKQKRLMWQDNGLQNYVSAASCAKILRMIYMGTCVSEDASKKMLELLKQQYYNDRISCGLPEGTVFAHKTGYLPELSDGDTGIVFTPGADLIVCMICNNQTSDQETIESMTEMGKLVYEYFNEDEASSAPQEETE